MKILKLVLNKALIPQIALAFNSVNLSHDCLLLSLVTLKLVGPVLLSHTRQYSLLSLSVSLCLLFLCLIFVVWRVMARSATELDSRLPWRMWRWSESNRLNAGINDVSVQLESGLTLLTYD